jgi:hypothetical protein
MGEKLETLPLISTFVVFTKYLHKVGVTSVSKETFINSSFVLGPMTPPIFFRQSGHYHCTPGNRYLQCVKLSNFLDGGTPECRSVAEGYGQRKIAVLPRNVILCGK